MTRYTCKTEGFGYPSYPTYTDISSVGDIETAVVSRIVVWYGDYINKLTVYLLLLTTD